MAQTYEQKRAAFNASQGTTGVTSTLATKPSPTSVTGLPKTNANSSVSGAAQPASAPYTNPTTSPTAAATNTAKNTTAYVASPEIPLASRPKTPPLAPSIPNPTGGSPLTQPPGVTGNQQQPILKDASAGGYEVKRDENGNIIKTGLPSSTGGVNTGPATGGTTATTTTGAVDENGNPMPTAADATNDYVAGLNDISKSFALQKQEDLDSIEREYQAKKDELAKTQAIMETLNQQRISSINTSTDAQKAVVEQAMVAQKEAIDLQKTKTDQAYANLQISKQLQNKRRMIEQETAMGILGGAFTSAGVADIQDVIMQGENDLLSLSKEADQQDQQFTNSLNDLNNQYKADNLTIEQYKTDSINKSYADLQQAILSISQDENLNETEKEESIRQVGQNYNQQITNISAQAVQARYNLAQQTITDAAQMKKDTLAETKLAQEEANKQRDDARLALNYITTNYPAEALNNMTTEQKLQLQTLQKTAGYPVLEGEQFSKTMKELGADDKNDLNAAKLNLQNRLADIKAQGLQVSNIQVDADGNATGAVYDKTNGKWSTTSLGNIGKPMAQFNFTVGPDGETIIPTNKVSGSVGTKVTPTDLPAEGAASLGKMNLGTNGGTPAVNGQPVDGAAFNKAFNVGGVGGWCGTYASTISTAQRVGDSWAQKINKVDKRDNPKGGDKLVIPVGVTDSASDMGHVIAITSFDPATGTLFGTQSNADGRQNKGNGQGVITRFEAKLSDLQNQYGDNFGFISGDFQPGIEAKLKSAGIAGGGAEVPKTGNWAVDAIGGAINNATKPKPPAPKTGLDAYSKDDLIAAGVNSGLSQKEALNMYNKSLSQLKSRITSYQKNQDLTTKTKEKNLADTSDPLASLKAFVEANKK